MLARGYSRGFGFQSPPPPPSPPPLPPLSPPESLEEPESCDELSPLNQENRPEPSLPELSPGPMLDESPAASRRGLRAALSINM